MAGPYYDPDGQLIPFEDWLTIDATPHEQIDRVGGAIVSTQFIGMSSAQPPLIYETLIIGGTHDGETRRYPNRDEAVAGQQRTVAQVRGEA